MTGKIFVDAMGGDQAPGVVIAGLAQAAPLLKAEVCVLGTNTQVTPLLKKYRNQLKNLQLEFIHCSEVVEMSDSPVQAVRHKKDSSIVRGMILTKQTPNSAFFSAGHSGAVLAAALFHLGRIPGIERPAIATALPTLRGHCILLDAGANVDVRPNHYVEFARMGWAYAKVLLKKDKPKVGILSNGEEESKGTEFTRAANELLKQETLIDYVGYVEGKDMMSGKVDVAVTDGFTGNIVLKSLEGLGRTVAAIIRSELERTILTKIGTLFSMMALKRVQKKLDYAEVGSAPLLGVDGNCFIGHGRSGARAIKNGIFRAQDALELDLQPTIRQMFADVRN
ncbi:MAG: phosphate acyltransferase PlsX [Bacteriovoracia bacterium]